MWQRINEQDNLIPTTAQTALHLENRRLLDRASRWFLQTRGGSLDVQGEIDRFAAVVSDRADLVPSNLLGKERERWERLSQRFMAAGAPEGLARTIASALDVFALLDITDICVRTGEAPDTVVPLYFAKERPVVERHGTLIMVDDDRFPLAPGEHAEMRLVRFRTLGCYPLTGAVESAAATLDDLIAEMRASEFSERQGRVIDHDSAGSMEKKKMEGYF